MTTTSPYRAEIDDLLGQVNAKLAKAERQLATGEPETRVSAAGELVVLRRRKEMLQDRLKQIDADPHAGAGLLAGLKQDWFDLVLALDRLIAHG